MREIKFRGKRLDNNEWAHGLLTVIEQLPIGKIAEIRHCEQSDGNMIETNTLVKANTVGQYTVHNDCNDVEIYEGDIVTDNVSNGKPFGVITWHIDGYFYIDEYFGNLPQYYQKCIPLGEMLRMETKGHPIEIKVIGNAFDNPELLEKEGSEEC